MEFPEGRWGSLHYYRRYELALAAAVIVAGTTCAVLLVGACS